MKRLFATTLLFIATGTISFPNGSDVYKTGYWNGTVEKVQKNDIV